MNNKMNGENEMSKIYLVLNDDNTYRAEAGEEKPCDGALELVEEGSYPTTVLSRRLDMNYDLVWENHEVEDHVELLESLNDIGARGWPVAKLWVFDIDGQVSPELNALFDKCYDKSAERLLAAIDAMFEDE